MDLDLENKVIIVTGGAKGIGRAISYELASEGAIPIIVGRSAEAARALESEIRDEGGRCLIIIKELGLNDVCKEVIQETISSFGRLDGIVNNAGVNDGVGLIDGSPKKFSESIQTNLSHYYDLVHYGIDYLKESKGSIVNISSKTALTGQGGTSGYAASKGAQLALTREWAVELAPFDIRVNAILPAEVMTPQYERWISGFDEADMKLQKITERIPLGNRMTTSTEIASMTLFLLSEKSSHTTGQWLFVDGGYVHLDRAI